MKPTEAQIRVLLVDDHRSVLWGLEKLINGEQPRMAVVATALSCEEGIRAIREHRPDVVLLDLDLGGRSGLDIVALFQHDAASPKIIVLTGVREPATREKAIMLGARGIVLKSEPADVILSAVQRVHAGELWIDRGTTARVFSSLARTHADGVRDCARSDVLTRRERWIVASVVRHKGAPNKVIADDLHISGHTLRNHLASIYSKLGVHRRLDLVLYAIERGLAQQPDV